MFLCRLLAQIYPQTKSVLKRLKQNHANWNKVKQKFWDGQVDDRAASPASHDESTAPGRIMASALSSADDYQEYHESCSSSVDSSGNGGVSRDATAGSVRNDGSSGYSRPRSTGCIHVPRRLHVQVHETFSSQRASHTVGANYTMFASKLQAARSSQASSFDMSPTSSSLGGLADLHFSAATVARVTDQFQSQIASHMSTLADEPQKTRAKRLMSVELEEDSTPPRPSTAERQGRRKGVIGTPAEPL